MWIALYVVLAAVIPDTEGAVTFTVEAPSGPFVELGADANLTWTYQLVTPHDSGKLSDVELYRYGDNRVEVYLAARTGIPAKFNGKMLFSPPATLTIKNFTKSDAAEYFVRLIFVGAQDVTSGTFKLGVRAMAKVTVKLPRTPKRLLVVQKNERTTLECTATGGPTPNIIWYKEVQNDRIKLKNGSGILIETEGTSSNLTFNRVRYEDVGKYQCVGENFGNESVDVNYLAFPYIDVLKGAQQVVSMGSDTVNLTCPVIGFPSPVYNWTYPDNTTRLDMQTLKVYLNGTYKCTGSNTGGKESFTFTVVSGRLGLSCNEPNKVKWNRVAMAEKYVVSYKDDRNTVDEYAMVGKTTELEIVMSSIQFKGSSTLKEVSLRVTVQAMLANDEIVSESCVDFRVVQ